jgi:hypothetical protein
MLLVPASRLDIKRATRTPTMYLSTWEWVCLSAFQQCGPQPINLVEGPGKPPFLPLYISVMVFLSLYHEGSCVWPCHVSLKRLVDVSNRLPASRVLDRGQTGYCQNLGACLCQEHGCVVAVCLRGAVLTGKM